MVTGFAYNDNHARHQKVGHVERPDRLNHVLSLLEDQELSDRLAHVESEPATLEDAALAHTPEYLGQLRRSIEMGGGMLDSDTYATRDSLDVALAALGCQLSLLRGVLEERLDNGFAATRPPGHHATAHQAMGFCLLSNVAVLARYAMKHYGVERVLIADFDVHHGNGTQDIFYGDPNVLYVSTHQWPLYPGTGRLEETGSGAGEGATINVPLPAGTGDDVYLDVFRKVLAPRAERFRPDLVLLSAGYDAHWKDLLGGMHLGTTGLAGLVRETMGWADRLCDGRLVAVLEGGYHAEALAWSVHHTLAVLQDPAVTLDDPLGTPPPTVRDLAGYVDEIAAFHVGAR